MPTMGRAYYEIAACHELAGDEELAIEHLNIAKRCSLVPSLHGDILSQHAYGQAVARRWYITKQWLRLTGQTALLFVRAAAGAEEHASLGAVIAVFCVPGTAGARSLMTWSSACWPTAGQLLRTRMPLLYVRNVGAIDWPICLAQVLGGILENSLR